MRGPVVCTNVSVWEHRALKKQTVLLFTVLTSLVLLP